MKIIWKSDLGSMKFTGTQSLIPCCGMTFKLQQSCTSNRDPVAQKAETSYYLTPVDCINQDCIKFSHVKVSLQYLSVIMQTDNQRLIIQMSPINTKGTLLCLHKPIPKT